jgi:hypothetical protein
MTVVSISQSFYFPWLGFWEQCALTDVLVHYNDVAFSKGSLTNRVQIKTEAGQEWLTVPLQKFALGTPIDQILTATNADWIDKQRRLFSHAYNDAPYVTEAQTLLDNQLASFVASQSNQLVDLLVGSFDATLPVITDAINTKAPKVTSSTDLLATGSKGDRVLAIVKEVGGTTYLTGWGARNYLDHQRFEDEGIQVRYVDYSRTQYRQCHGEFTPYVSVLDAVANVGWQGLSQVTRPQSISWRDAMARA